MFITAAASSVETYGGQGGSVAHQVNEQASSIPFTGLDVLVIVGIAIVLLLAGMAMARISHPE